MFKWLNAVLPLIAAIGFCGCKSVSVTGGNEFSHFVGFENFSNLDRFINANGESVLLFPAVRPPSAWNELIVSWNADAPPGTFLKVEASAMLPGRQTKFYTLGIWSADEKAFARASIRGQKDGDGDVDTDTLILKQPAAIALIRVTLGGTNGALPMLKFLGVSFSNTKTPAVTHPPNHAAWGKIISTPEFSQHGHPNAKGWCSPASLAMVLARWAVVLNRPEMNLTVPQVADAVFDSDLAGTGNWPFNTAFAGSFTGMRACVTRFDDISEIEDWIAAGVPVILSTRWDWLAPGRPFDPDGHLIVCIGFTENGDVVVNDPSAHLEKGEPVRRIYKRADVIHAWTKSHYAVYLIYPVGAKIPANKHGHF